MLPMYFGLPDAHLFELPPDSHPLPSSPASRSQLSWDRPINISPALFDHTLDVKLPLLIATLYALTVCTLNYINRKRRNRPWPLSRSPLFHQFVLIHNVGLVLFSAWLTLVVHPGVLEFDSLWDRGIDYYMWMFYMSKFYEIVDTMLLLVKGKKSSFLQTYHHAGVMLCTWAGVRYVSPPGLIGLLLNSVIHTIMVSDKQPVHNQYLYYTLTTFKVSIPGFLKRILTGMQIAQFILGSILAWSYIFISYDASIWPPLASINNKREENRGNESRTSTLFHEDNSQLIPCLDNSGQVLALLLTTVYLIPLTFLFVRFFIRSYLSGSKRKLVKH
ncbi:hypothetical protein AO1008_01624 [Aspergillus oryzae 100-8]|uniref:Elongation of fatty acids protein n=1 Tax=Aspergillus oryzae (strain 3.042) TaxID=1160506 RepID=I7ZQK7_ASPO3|nr:hypothetical protein Ao3042_09706 [Aspergillus oryzae 3.042]KDE75923.1 hypothetical protein AO1008_01624 [Aspergillus oryzae 100-8]|eukprot:EIT74279.1 hypothetical protein Ao3042_09706 [Aspergillus oryzae 3.042]